MADPLIDYNELAEGYDAGRQLPTDQAAFWSGLIAGQLDLLPGAWLLDVGCGTGRFAIALAAQTGCPVVGLDPAGGMLARARAKAQGQGRWLRGCAARLPFATGAFQACFMSQVLHHFADKAGALREAYRVLAPGGKLGLRFTSHAQLRARLDFRFFPGALDLECARTPDLPAVVALLQGAGFTLAAQLEVRLPLAETPDAYLAKLAQRYTSVLRLLPESEFARGLRQAQGELAGRAWSEGEAQAGTTFLVARN